MTPETFSVAELAEAFGLKPDATKLAVIGAIRALGAGIVTLGTDLKTIQDAIAASSGAGNIVVFSAKIDGKDITAKPDEVLSRLIALEARVTNTDVANLDSERGKIVALFATEGKAPINPDTLKPYSGDELKKLALPELKLLHANTPVSVPLSARSRTSDTSNTTIDPNLKGVSKVAAAFNRDQNNK